MNSTPRRGASWKSNELPQWIAERLPGGSATAALDPAALETEIRARVTARLSAQSETQVASVP